MSFNKADLMAMFIPKVVKTEVVVGDDSMEIYVRELSAKQVFDLQAQQKKKTMDGKEFSFLLLSEALSTEDGDRLMTVEEVRELALLKVQAFNNLTEAVAKAVGLQPQKEEQGKV